MKYHKIRNIAKEVCTAEQKIAYNIAFRVHISSQDEFDYLRKNKCEAIVKDFVDGCIQEEMTSYKINYPNSKYDFDCIFSALNAGLEKYLNNPFIASDYETIGKAFPAYYL